MSSERDLNSAEVEPSDFLRKRRHKAVNDLRADVYNARMRARDAVMSGVPHDVANDVLRAAVENYVTEIEPLLVNTEQGHEYWTEADLGTVYVLPPDDGQEYAEAGYEYDIVGLEVFQSAPDRFVEQFTTETEDLTTGRQRELVRVEVAMPEHVTWTAFRYTNQFAYEIGLDIDHKDEIPVEADPF